MFTRWFQFKTDSLPRGVVVLDATDASATLWDGPIVSVLEDLRDRLLPAARPDVCFLGDRRTHSLEAVLEPLLGRTRPGAVDHRQNLGRFPVAGPFLREWERTPPRPVVLVANTPVRDLEDWATDEATAALLVYRLTGASRLTSAPWRELGPEADLRALADHLRDPAEEVRFGGGAAYVLDWLGDGFRCANGELRGCPAEGAAVRALLACLDGHEPLAELRRTSGTRLICGLEPADPTSPEVISLAEPAANVMRVWRAGQNFFCFACGAAHRPGQLWCRSGTDKPLLPELGARPRGTAWALKFDGGWTATPFPRGAAVAGDLVLVSGRGEWSARALADGEWAAVDPPDPLVAIGENEYLVPG